MADPEQVMESLMCHGPLSLRQLCTQVAGSALALPSQGMNLGLCCRVRCTLHSATHSIPPVVRLFTAMVKQVFPEDPFLAIKVVRNPQFGPHKDQQNSYLPNLIVELQSSEHGGTWVETPHGTGDVALECPDDTLRWGQVLSGNYRLSARTRLHASYPGKGDRLLLIAWTPAAWQVCTEALLTDLQDLGFVVPTPAQLQRARVSSWGPQTSWQPSLTFQSGPVWPVGSLQPGNVTLQILSEDESTDAAYSDEDVLVGGL